MSQEMKYKLHVISHTHWDREWYFPFQDFRARLVDLIDYLLDLLENNPEYKYFHLDGQTIVLEDYLEIRPENEDRLRHFIEEGRIIVGPWYILPDEFLVSGEALVRNLLIGHQMAADYGNIMKVGHIPDTFGHISQMPQILKGFDIDNGLLFRGITADQVKSEFIWQGPDGSKIIVAKMSDEVAYSNFFYKLIETLRTEEPLDPEQLRSEIEAMVKERADQALDENLLSMDGVDHVFPNPKTPEIINWINENMDNLEAVHTDLSSYFNLLMKKYQKNIQEDIDKGSTELQEISGELRVSNRKWRLQALLAGVLSSRIHLKQENTELQHLLEKWVEPVTTINWMMGEDYPAAFIREAWKYLLKNHPHDSICGCSIDQVHQDMQYRYDQCRLIGERLFAGGLETLTEKINTSVFTDDEKAMIVFNTLSWERNEVVKLELLLPPEKEIRGFKVTTHDDKDIDHQVLSQDETWIKKQEKHDIPRTKKYQRYQIALSASSVPAMGYKTYKIEPLKKFNRQTGSMVTGPKSMANNKIEVNINSNGTFNLLDKETGQIFENLLYVEDGGDAGDGYQYVKPKFDQVYNSLGEKATISLVEDGPLLTSFKVELTMKLPAGLNQDKKSRQQQVKEYNVISYITLTAASKRVDIKTEINNNIKDHRLRVCFPTGINTDKSYAESQFDIVERPVSTPDCSDWIEPQPSFHPQLNFTDVNNEQYGLTINNQGLPEYEVKEDKERTIALTLLRAVGGGVGQPELLKNGQCPGKYTFNYAVYPHQGDVYQSRVWQEAYNYNIPLVSQQTGSHKGKLPVKKSFINIENEEIVITTCKRCDKRESIIVRLVNMTEGCINTSCKLSFSLKDVYSVNLNEDRKAKLNYQVIDGRHVIDLKFKPKEIITLELQQ